MSGSPAPAAKWFKNGKELAAGPSHQRQHNNLAFAKVTRADAGSYACAVETEQGAVTSVNYTVNVLGEKHTRFNVQRGIMGRLMLMLRPFFPPQSPFL